jgi:hypoxanthine phosphoribosyltransferase
MEIVIDTGRLRAGVARLAAEIDRDLAGRPALIVGVLKGSIFFLADLARRLAAPVSLDYVQAASYGARRRPERPVRLLREVAAPVPGRDVVLVDDIVDTGATLKSLRGYLLALSPASLRTCVLLRKRRPGAHAIPVDYVGFEIEDRFVVGYGLDLGGDHRSLPHVAALDEPPRRGGDG